MVEYDSALSENPDNSREMSGENSEDDVSDIDEREMLEELLRMLSPRSNITQIADNLIQDFGSLRDALLVPANRLKDVDGVSEKLAIQLGFFGELSQYLRETETEERIKIDNKAETMNYLIKCFSNRSYETFLMLLLDENRYLLHSFYMSNNMPNSCEIEFRIVLKEIIKYNARKLLVAHNHPIGDVIPSGEDLKLTRSLGNSLRNYKIPLIDHVIVSADRALSMRDEGYLKGIWMD